jgi:zinc transporter
MENNAFFTACILTGEGGSKDISPDKIRDWKSEDNVLWLDINYSDPKAQSWLKEESGLPEFVIDALIAEDSRPRTSIFDHGILLILRGVNLNPGAAPDDMISIRLWIEKNRIISTRMRDLFSLKDIHSFLRKNKGPSNVAEFIVVLVKQLVLHMTDTIDDLEDLITEIEENILSDKSENEGPDLGVIRRQIIKLSRYLTPERDALTHLIDESDKWIDENHRQQIHEIRDQLVRYLEELNALRERASIIQEEILSWMSDNLNKRMYVISLIAAIFLPLGFLTGLLGVNLAGIPGAENPQSFYIFGAILFIILLFQILFFRLKKWF